MGRRRNRRQRERNSILGSSRDLERESQIMGAKVRDLDPRVAGILRQLPEATEAQKLELALLLQKVARGPASLLERPESGDLVTKMRAEAHARDAVAARYNDDKVRFVEEVFDRADKIKLTGEKADQVKARAAKMLAEATASARARNSVGKKNFERLVRSMPTRPITVTGHVEMQRHGDNIQATIVPEVIRLKHLTWVLPPGVHQVPEIVAQVFEQRQLTTAATAARERALQATGEAGRDTNVFEKWREIGEQYGQPSELPLTYGII